MSQASMTDKIALAALKNKTVQNAVKKSLFESVVGKDQAEAEDNQRTHDASVIQGIDEEEMAKILKWSKFLRISMIVVSILCIITSWYNLAVSTNSVSTNFLAAYVFFFSMIICCYELALKQVAVLIVQNFGFMYNPFGRSIFLAFLAILLYQLSTMGKVMFAILIVMGIIQIYVDIRHPKFETYKRTMHFYNKASATKSSANPVVTMNPMSVSGRVLHIVPPLRGNTVGEKVYSVETEEDS